MSVTNPNVLNPSGFFVTIGRLPNVAFWCNSVSLPGFSIANPEQPNPFNKIPVPGDRGDLDPLVMSFNVDEDLKNWMELMRWFIGFAFPQDHKQFVFGLQDETGSIPGTKDNFYTDISVTILSSHKNPIATFTYHNCIPQNVSGIELTVADSDINPITCSATFEFSHFSVLKPSTTIDVDSLV